MFIKQMTRANSLGLVPTTRPVVLTLAQDIVAEEPSISVSRSEQLACGGMIGILVIVSIGVVTWFVMSGE